MLLLNYAHPLTEAQQSQVQQLLGATPEIRELMMQVDRARPLAEVARELAEHARLSATAWQTRPIIINPPGLAPLAAAVLAEIHGRSGHFPAILNIRPIVEATLPDYEVAEIINLQQVRDVARQQRLQNE